MRSALEPAYTLCVPLCNIMTSVEACCLIDQPRLARYGKHTWIAADAAWADTCMLHMAEILVVRQWRGQEDV